MARLNMIIRAFEAHELRMLNDVIIHREQQAIDDGFILPEPFQELKDIIQLANKYFNGINRDSR